MDARGVASDCKRDRRRPSFNPDRCYGDDLDIVSNGAVCLLRSRHWLPQERRCSMKLRLGIESEVDLNRQRDFFFHI